MKQDAHKTHTGLQCVETLCSAAQWPQGLSVVYVVCERMCVCLFGRSGVTVRVTIAATDRQTDRQENGPPVNMTEGK